MDSDIDVPPSLFHKAARAQEPRERERERAREGGREGGGRVAHSCHYVSHAPPSCRLGYVSARLVPPSLFTHKGGETETRRHAPK